MNYVTTNFLIFSHEKLHLSAIHCWVLVNLLDPRHFCDGVINNQHIVWYNRVQPFGAETAAVLVCASKFSVNYVDKYLKTVFLIATIYHLSASDLGKIPSVTVEELEKHAWSIHTLASGIDT